MAEAPKTTRTRKSAAERAQADLAKAQKTYDAAVAKRDKLAESVAPAEAAVIEAQRQLDYVSRNPALPQADADGGLPVSSDPAAG